jgi:putative transcriptional regulator
LSPYEKCPACGSTDVAFKRGHHHFLESGLDNVHLSNADIWLCNACGEEIVSIPRSMELMKSIAESILLKPTSLSGAEIRFLRKNLTLKINEFSQLLGVDRVTVSRWENDHEKPSKSADRLIRLMYAVEAKVSDAVMEPLRRNLRKEDVDSQVDYFVLLPLAS